MLWNLTKLAALSTQIIFLETRRNLTLIPFPLLSVRNVDGAKENDKEDIYPLPILPGVLHCSWSGESAHSATCCPYAAKCVFLRTAWSLVSLSCLKKY